MDSRCQSGNQGVGYCFSAFLSARRPGSIFGSGADWRGAYIFLGWLVFSPLAQSWNFNSNASDLTMGALLGAAVSAITGKGLR